MFLLRNQNYAKKINQYKANEISARLKPSKCNQINFEVELNTFHSINELF